MRRRGVDDDLTNARGLQAAELGDLVLCRHHKLGAAAIEPVLQFIRGQQRGGRNDDDAELDRRQHGLPQRHHIAEQQQQMIAALQPLRAQEIGNLIGAA
jgi:hypothetical protein